jgi:hypothetical protein
MIGIVTPRSSPTGHSRKPGRRFVTQTYAAARGCGRLHRPERDAVHLSSRAPLAADRGRRPLAQLQKPPRRGSQRRARPGGQWQRRRGVQQNIESQRPGAQVASRDVADRISARSSTRPPLASPGVARRARRLTAFLIAPLLTLLGRARPRDRHAEGVPDAARRRPPDPRSPRVRRRRSASSQRRAGAVISRLTLTASSTGGERLLRSAVTARTVTDQVALTAPVVRRSSCSVFSRSSAAWSPGRPRWRAARIQPADALRQVEVEGSTVRERRVFRRGPRP